MTCGWNQMDGLELIPINCALLSYNSFINRLLQAGTTKSVFELNFLCIKAVRIGALCESVKLFAIRIRLLFSKLSRILCLSSETST